MPTNSMSSCSSKKKKSKKYSALAEAILTLTEGFKSDAQRKAVFAKKGQAAQGATAAKDADVSLERRN
jgi:hypothetical protein